MNSATKKTKEQPSAARCDYCGSELGCLVDSIRAREYWRGQGFTPFYTCDACLPSVMDDFPHLEGKERLLALRLLHARGVSLPRIEETIAAALGKGIPRQQLTPIREQQEKVFQLHNEGELVATVWAAQALWAQANHLHESMATLKERVTGLKFLNGRKPGTKGPVRKAVEAYLKKHPAAKNAEIWLALKGKPPRGWTFMENRQGRYIEGPEPGDNIDIARFRNICADARRPAE